MHFVQKLLLGRRPPIRRGVIASEVIVSKSEFENNMLHILNAKISLMVSRYCECFQCGLVCSEKCRCHNCKNYPTSSERTKMRQAYSASAGLSSSTKSHNQLDAPQLSEKLSTGKIDSHCNSSKTSSKSSDDSNIIDKVTTLTDLITDDKIRMVRVNLCPILFTHLISKQFPSIHHYSKRVLNVSM
jgi:hypothetical protein